MAGEAIVAVVAEEAVVGCINQIKHQFNYLRQYHDNMENLNTKLLNLETKRAEVQDKVLTATDKGETIMSHVHNWLGQVGGKKEEAEDILKDKEKVGNGCWKGWFVNVNVRYTLSKKAIKKSVDLDTFLKRCVFELVAQSKRPLAHVYDPVGASSSEKVKKDMDHQILEVEGNEESKEGTTSSNLPPAGADGGLTSRLVFLNDVMAAVRDPNIRIIRICGMGGIGKTTVAEQVKQRATAEHLFHEIAMIEVNQDPDLKILQLHIAESFGLELKEDSVTARAERLCERLNAKGQNGESKRILLILDNVWKKEGLKEAGIPLTDEKSFCKILLTSRSDLVCKDIAPEPEFNIGVLPHPENLNLFRQCIPTESFYNRKMAEDLVKECGGLPISIATIAGAVKYGEKETWADALTKLQKSEFKGEYAKVFNSLKVSYDFLENEEIKSFFRLFCFFRKGSDVLIEDLARYGMALQCFPDSDRLYEARNEAHSYANKLLHSNLLLLGGKAGCFKVHDIIWDFAVQAPSSDLFFINHGDALIKSTRTECNQNYTSISLECSEMVEVPKVVDFRNLKFLQLTGNWYLNTLPLEFPNNFFEDMNELKVLAFRNLKLPSLPKSPQLLNNLLSLSFDRCSIGSDISIIGNLVKLEILSFAYSDIEELPIQIANLKELRLLNMTRCRRLLVIAPYVLSELSSLEELYMRGTPLQLGSRSPTLFSEIASMSKLVVIDIVVPVVALPMDSLFAKLKHFKISVTKREIDKENGYLSMNCLDLECDSTVLQQPGVKLLLQETVRMDLKNTNLKCLFPLNNSEVVSFSNLKYLSIESCNEMEYLVHMMGHPDQMNVFQELVSLRLYWLLSLVDIFHVWGSDQSFVAPFCNLKVLNVEMCSELEHLFSASDARSLNMLEIIVIKNCADLKVVFGKGRRDGDKVELRNLKYLTLCELRNLVGFCSDVDPPEFPQLEELTIECLPLITSIFHSEIGSVDSSHNDDSSSHPLFSYKGLHTSCKFQNLKELSVSGCYNVIHLWTTSIAISFRKLEILSVEYCESLTTLIAEEGIKEENEKKSATEVMLFPKLKHLKLNKLRSISTFLPKGYTLTWSSLKQLTLEDCGGEWNTLFPNKNNIQGGTITSATTAAHKVALTNLEELSFVDMDVPLVFWYDYFPGGFSYQLREFFVSSSEESIIMFLPHMTREFQHLTITYVKYCESLEVVFDLEEECIVGSKLPTLNKLDFLAIDYLPNMVNIWKNVPHNFQGFGNLTTLQVRDCDSLRYLFVPSIAKCLVKLQKMEIHDCQLIEEIVSMRDEQGQLGEKIILFPELKYLSLKKLPCLIYLESPNIDESSGAHDDVYATSTSTSNITYHKESIDTTSRASVTLQGIICLWRWSFHKLENIDVYRCKNLLSLFPPNTIVKLPALEKISVEDCGSLKYIFSSSMATSLDRRIKVVFNSLKSVKLENLPNFEGVYLGMLSIDWPLLEDLIINDCSKMRIFTSGYSTTPHLNCLRVNGESYNPTMEEGDVNTVLWNAQMKIANLALHEEGTLSITDFHLAGEQLIGHYSSWSWESSNDKREQYLIARNVPCLRNTTSDDENKVGDGEDDMNIYKPRTYDVSITYDRYYKSTCFWLKGYDESKMDLPLDLVLQDIVSGYPEENVTVEDHPHESGPHVSIYPVEESCSFAKELFLNLREHKNYPTVHNHLQICLDVLFPTIQFGPAAN